MSASEATERKGKFFKAIITAPPDLKKPKKATPRTLPALQSRQCRPVDRAPSTPKAALGPTGEAVTTGGDARGTPNILGRLDGTTDVKFAGADRCGDDARNLTKLLFSRNVTGFLNRGEKLEDVAIIQAIFNANNGPHQPGMEDPTTQTPAHEPTASRMEPVLPSLSQPGPVCSAQSDPAQLISQTTGAASRAYSPLLVRGKQRNVLSLAKSEGKGESGGRNATKGTDKRYVGRQRTACAHPMRLPKLSVQQRDETGKAGSCGREDGGHSSDTARSGTTNLKRHRCRQMSKLTGSTDTSSHSTPASVSYPCPRNLTVIQRRGCHATTRACSPMPSLRKPLPPIRRRHHSDICTVCPEVHDWKGLARNPRWYSTKTGERCSCERGKDAEAESNIDGEVCKTETAPTETVDGEKVQTLGRKEDTEEGNEEVDEATQDGAEESNWFPESSIAVQESKDQEVDVEDKVFPHDSDESRIKTNPVCDALRNAHCPWLAGLASFDDRKNSTDETEPKSRMSTKGDHDDHHLQARLMMEGMDFECDSKTEIEFQDDNTLLQAVLLRNRALHHGVVSDSGDPESPSEVKVPGGVRVDDGKEAIVTRTKKRFEDRNMILYYCTPLLRESSESTGRTNQANHDVDRRASQIPLTPRAEVIMTSRGQQKVVNSSLVAVGRGQSGGKVKSGEEVFRISNSNEAKNDSSEVLLRQEMDRYLHSLRHENASDRRHHGLSSAQNVPMKVQNLTAVRPITADVSNTSVLASQVTKAVGFIPILTREEYDSLCKKTTGPPARLPRAPAMPPIVGNPSEMLLIKRFDGEVKGMRLPRRREKNKK